MPIKKFFSTHHGLLAAVVLLVCCLVTFSNSFDNGFLMDDVPMLLANKTANVIHFLQFNFTGHQRQVYFRPVYHFFMLATHAFFGDQPLGYNVLNIVLYYFACLAVYHLIKTLIKDFLPALMTGILFCVHPINGVLANHKVCAGYSVLVITAVLSLTKYVQALEERDDRSGFILSGIYFCFALMCHEVAVMVPLLLMCVLFFVKRYDIKMTFLKSFPLLAVLGCYLIFRFFYFSLKNSVIDNISYFGMSYFQYFASYAKLIFWYLSKLFIPEGIVLAWETYVLPESIFIWCLLYVLMIAALLFFIVKYWKRDIIAFSLIWLFIGFGIVPLACFSRPALGFVIQPHWLSVPSIGFFLSVAVFLSALRKRMNKKVWILLVCLIVLACVLKSRQYNNRWNSQKKYCRYWLTVSPQSFWPNFWLGHSYMVEGDYAKAKIHFIRNLKKGIHDEEIYGNLGIVEYELKNYDDSILYLEKALAIKPDSAETHYYLGRGYIKKKMFRKAEEYYLQAIELDRYLLSPREGLALLYESRERNEKALAVRRDIKALSNKEQ